MSMDAISAELVHGASNVNGMNGCIRIVADNLRRVLPLLEEAKGARVFGMLSIT
jgi:hypothetical protein